MGANLQAAVLSSYQGSDLGTGEVDLDVQLNALLDITGRTNLRGANLHGANLNDAELNGANLERAKLETSQLRYANLISANLVGANLFKVDLEMPRYSMLNLRALECMRLTSRTPT
jgi:uncharacterized protein YjbI with pentapeptide repeats